MKGQLQDFTWCWEYDKKTGLEKVSLTSRGSSEVFLTQNKYGKWFTNALEKTWISFKPNGYNSDTLDVFLRSDLSFYSIKLKKCYGSGLVIFNFSKDDEVVRKDDKWISVKKIKRKLEKTASNKETGFMF